MKGQQIEQLPHRNHKQTFYFRYVRVTLQEQLCSCLPTFPVRHFYGPGAVERIGVKIWKARREDGPRLSIDIASTKGCREDKRDIEK